MAMFGEEMEVRLSKERRRWSISSRSLFAPFEKPVFRSVALVDEGSACLWWG